jgi:release factor glutamine methyltransferase
MSPIYPPAEDSSLMSEVLEREVPKSLTRNLKILEIGAGSGIQLETLKKIGIKNKDLFSCDINPKAVAHCKKLKFNCIQSDLFSKINDKFDLIIFNPPYLPLDKNEPRDSQIATTGGKNGSEIINRFLKDAKDFLTSKGKIILITSSLTKNINWQNYKKKKLDGKKLFFEKLNIWELSC